MAYWCLTSVYVAEVGDVRHFLQQGEVEAPGLDQGPGPPDVDSLAPLPCSRIEHVNVGVAVDEEEAVLGGGYG